MPRRYSWISRATERGEVLAVDEDLAFAGTLLQQQQAQKRGLAGAARAGQEDELAFLDGERQVPQRVQAATVELREMVRLDHASVQDSMLAGRSVAGSQSYEPGVRDQLPATSYRLELALQQIAGQLRIRLAAAALHDLADEEAERLHLPGAVLRDGVGIACR